MNELYDQAQMTSNSSIRIRDLEENMRLLKDRVILIGQNLIDERDKNVKNMQEVKRMLIKIKEENDRIKEVLERVTEQLGNVVRKDELSIVQRQLNLLRK